MKYKLRLFILMVIFLASNLLTQFCSTVKAVVISKSEVTSEKQNTSQGLLGYYFNEVDFNGLALVTNQPTGDLRVSSEDLLSMLTIDNKSFQSAFWYGLIQVEESGLYTFETSSNFQTKLWIDSHQLINQSENCISIQLEKGKSYELKMEYQNTMHLNKKGDLQLYWIKPNNQKEIIPPKNLLLPKNITDEKKGEKLNTFQRSKRNIGMQLNNQTPDSDNDGIPDSLEINGYTVDIKNGKFVIVGWNENIHSRKKLKKYYSSPMKWSTASDPYSDFQKVTGLIDKQVKQEARHPLVVAYPIVNTVMENIIISKNQNISFDNGGIKSNTLSKSMVTSKTDSISSSISAEMNASALDFGAKVTTSFSKEHSSTTSIERETSNTTETSWSNTVGIQTGESAYFGANLRYINLGTAPIYKVRPTTTFVIGENQVFATIMAKENQLANVLKPNEYYPAKTQAPIIINTKDDFGSNPIILNFNQLNLFEQQKKIRVETDQVSGEIGMLQENGEIQLKSDWSLYLPQIENTSARIIFDTKKHGAIERRITAIDPNDLQERTKPEVTIKEALKLAFGAIEQNGQMYYENTNMAAFEFICDEKTFLNIHSQLEHMENKDIYNAKLNAKMNILVKEISIQEAINQLFTRYKNGKGLKSNVTKARMDHIQEAINGQSESTLKNQLQSLLDDAKLLMKFKPYVKITKNERNENRIEFKPNTSIPEITGYSLIFLNGGISLSGYGSNIVEIDSVLTNYAQTSDLNFVISLQNGSSYVLYAK
ncbi:binary toxin-like calcium binding domain-containing protein [Bacillus cereus]|uniref:binary toxin-like calcium binding domain-containing protein n=1 Tax=Bacillus cereus TaxID=1396 RepID=UPI000C291212|nr:binary toxin-like calcium binding domain-containing protein [Bacillus cereus]